MFHSTGLNECDEHGPLNEMENKENECKYELITSGDKQMNHESLIKKSPKTILKVINN